MASSRQATLMESWGAGIGAGGPGPGPSVSRGGHSNVGSGNSSRGRGGRGRGSGRGSRGAKKKAGVVVGSKKSSTTEGVFEDDDDDVLFDAALSHFELTTNDVSKAFEEVNSFKELPGFDATAGDIWIYPTNRPVRDYQFNIVQTALYHNTLVSLPTGLGKTFIAAVLMYNFHRWYPNNIIVFMAPTRPLVTQQLDACHELMGIAPSKMVELTGQTIPKKREELWKEKKVFFLTPQVMTSDLGRGFCPAGQVRCIVVDEAHKSMGNHAYVQVIRMVAERNKCFRILALSATPGNDIAAVQQVLQNLLISRVELRSETSFDILPYTHQKQVETVVVPLDEHINTVHNKVLEIFQIFTGKLMKLNVLFGRDGSSFTQFQLLRARDLYRQNPPSKMANYQKGYIEADFGTCITLAHSLELLIVHGLRSFYSFLHGVVSKQKGHPAVAAELKKSTNIEEILADVQTKLNISAENSFFDLSMSGLFTTFSKPDTSGLAEPANPEDYLLSHPKMRVLKDIVAKHFKSFQEKGQSTRVMVFSQYRDSVQEIGNMLNSLRPLVKPMVFVGQAKSSGTGSGRGLKQKEQAQVVQGFRSGGFNVLVSTCVGEEGLDIGEVDLIICFDASKSPTRLVQRMGRTGRQRQGRTIFLLAQGREQRMYSSSVSQQGSISRSITDTRQLNQFLYKQSPRMVPAGINPQCYKMDIILSSEQKGIERVEEKKRGIDVDEDGFVLPPRSRAKASNKESKTKKRPKASTTVISNDTGDRNRKTKTITEYFENALKNGAKRTYGNPEADHPKIYEDDDSSDCQIIEDHNISFHEPFQTPVLHGSDYGNYLQAMLGIKKVDGNTSVRCVYVPKLSEPELEWLPEYNDLDPRKLILQDFEIECLREKLNAVYMLGPTTSHCDCGILNDYLADFEADLDVGVDIPEDYCSHARNSVKSDSFKSKCVLACIEAKIPVIEDLKPQELDTISEMVERISQVKVVDPVARNDFGSEFEFNENDPLFVDDWNGDPEPVFQNLPPVSANTPRPERFRPSENVSNWQTGIANEQPEEVDDPLFGDDWNGDPEPVFQNLPPVSANTPRPERFRASENVSKWQTEITNEQPEEVDDPLFGDDWNGDPEPVFQNLPPASVTPPRFRNNENVLKRQSDIGAIKTPGKVDMVCLDDDSGSSTTSDEAFTPVIRALSRNRRGVNSSVFLTGEQEASSGKIPRPMSSILSSPVRYVSEPSLPLKRVVLKSPAQSIPVSAGGSGKSSSSDECFPPSPEITKRVVKKKFVFRKKSAASSPAQEINLAGSIGRSQHLPTLTGASLSSASQSFIERAKPCEAKPAPDVSQVTNVSSEGKSSPFPPLAPKILSCLPLKRAILAPQALPVSVNKEGDSSSSDECFPPSPEPLKNPVKKKFVFQKKVTAISLATNGAQSSRTVEQLQPPPPPPVPGPSSASSFSDWIKLSDIRQTPAPAPSRSSSFSDWVKPSDIRPPPPARQPNIPSTSKTPTITLTPHVPTHMAILPFRNNFETQNENLNRALGSRSPSPDPDFVALPKSFRFKLPAPRATNSSIQLPSQNTKRRRRKPRKRNQFLIDEAEVSGNDSSDDDEDSDFESLDSSFVSKEVAESPSESQQVRYLKSVTDTHLKGGRPDKKPLHEVVLQGLNNNNYTDTDYEEDSFVVRNEDIEFAEVGVFTQAMAEAQEVLAKESPSKRYTKVLRRNRGAKSVPVPVSPGIPQPKRRRRIITYSDEDS